MNVMDEIYHLAQSFSTVCKTICSHVEAFVANKFRLIVEHIHSGRARAHDMQLALLSCTLACTTLAERANSQNCSVQPVLSGGHPSLPSCQKQRCISS